VHVTDTVSLLKLCEEQATCAAAVKSGVNNCCSGLLDVGNDWLLLPLQALAVTWLKLLVVVCSGVEKKRKKQNKRTTKKQTNEQTDKQV